MVPGVVAVLHTLYTHRAFIVRRALADLRNRYAGTAGGVVYNVVHPLALIGVYAAVFTNLMAGHTGGAREYVLRLCAGLLAWVALADAVTRGTAALVANANYLKKLPIPEPVFVAQAAVSATVGLAIGFGLLLIVGLAVGLQPRAAWVLLPVPIVLLQLLGLGVGLGLAALNAFVRDVGEWVPVTLQLVFWTVPIVYPAAVLPDALAAALPWHPLYPAITALQDLFVRGAIPPAGTWVAMAAWPVAALACAAGVLRAVAWEIRDVL